MEGVKIHRRPSRTVASFHSHIPGVYTYPRCIHLRAYFVFFLRALLGMSCGLRSDSVSLLKPACQKPHIAVGPGLPRICRNIKNR